MSEDSERSSGSQKVNRRSLIMGVAGAAVLGGMLGYGPANTLLAASPSVPFFRGSTSSATVALTFDCGSDLGYTYAILNTAGTYGVPITFGVTGQYARAYPDAVATMVAEGHGIMNHSDTHPSFTGGNSSTVALDYASRLAQVQKAENAIYNAAGVHAKPYFRPPFGDYNASSLQFLGDQGYSYSIMWTIDVLGWNGLSRQKVINRALANHGNGYVYLMHVGAASQEGPALESIILGLRDKGYSFVHVSQMLGGSAPVPTVTPTPPSTPYTPGMRLKVTSGLYLRSGAGLGTSVYITMPTATVVTVVSGPTSLNGYTWYQLDTPYGQGWAAGEYLTPTGEATPTPTVPASPTPTTGHVPGTKLKVTSGLYLRSRAGFSASVITTMSTGTVVTVVSGPTSLNNLTWYQIDTPYGGGWAAGEYLTPTGETAPTPTSTSTPTSTPTSAPTNTPTPTNTPASTPTPSVTPTPPAVSGHAPGTTLKVTSRLYLRGSVGTGTVTHAVMPIGTVVTVVTGPTILNGYTWYQLDTPYGRGWAAGEYLTPTGTITPTPTSTPNTTPTPTTTPIVTPPPVSGHAPGTTLRVTSGLYLRSGAGFGTSVYTTMPTGTVVTVVSGPTSLNNLTWYQLDTPYGRGWAAGEYLTVTTSVPSPPPPTTSYAPGTTLKVTSGLYLRSDAGFSASVYTTMPTGTVVIVVSGPTSLNNLTWYQLDTPYGRGWAADKDLAP